METNCTTSGTVFPGDRQKENTKFVFVIVQMSLNMKLVEKLISDTQIHTFCKST